MNISKIDKTEQARLMTCKYASPSHARVTLVELKWDSLIVSGDPRSPM